MMGAGWGQISKERQAEISEDRLREWPKLKDEVVKLKEENTKLRALIKRLLKKVQNDELIDILVD